MSVDCHRRNTVSTHIQDSSLPRSIFETPKPEVISAEDFWMAVAETICKKLLYRNRQKYRHGLYRYKYIPKCFLSVRTTNRILPGSIYSVVFGYTYQHMALDSLGVMCFCIYTQTYLHTHTYTCVGCIPSAAGMHEYIFTHTFIVLNPVVSKCFKKEPGF